MKKAVWLILVCLLLPGCSTLSAGKHTLSSLSGIEVDMDKRDVEKRMGQPNVVRIGKKVSDDTVYELHEYKLYDDFSVTALDFSLIIPAQLVLGTETYWLHYINSKLVFWGEEGNWRGAPKWFSSYYANPSAGQTGTESKAPNAANPN